MNGISYHSVLIHSTPSTMEEARKLSHLAPSGCVRALEQTSGRGRLPGRVWHSAPGASLLATWWFAKDTFGDAPLPLIAGLAVLEACRGIALENGSSFGDGLRLKWPNDLLCGTDEPETAPSASAEHAGMTGADAHRNQRGACMPGRKLAGILCEASGTTIYAGIGVNLTQRSFTPPYGESWRRPPTSIFLETGLDVDAEVLEERIRRGFELLGAEADGWHRRYESVLAWKGNPVLFSPGTGNKTLHGHLVGTDCTGRVRILVDGTMEPQVFSSGELSLPGLEAGDSR